MIYKTFIESNTLEPSPTGCICHYMYMKHRWLLHTPSLIRYASLSCTDASLGQSWTLHIIGFLVICPAAEWTVTITKWTQVVSKIRLGDAPDDHCPQWRLICWISCSCDKPLVLTSSSWLSWYPRTSSDHHILVTDSSPKREWCWMVWYCKWQWCFYKYFFGDGGV